LTAQIFWLKNRKLSEWRDVQNIEHAIGSTSSPTGASSAPPCTATVDDAVKIFMSAGEKSSVSKASVCTARRAHAAERCRGDLLDEEPRSSFRRDSWQIKRGCGR
jgi:hypothetical protein